MNKFVYLFTTLVALFTSAMAVEGWTNCVLNEWTYETNVTCTNTEHTCDEGHLYITDCPGETHSQT